MKKRFIFYFLVILVVLSVNIVFANKINGNNARVLPGDKIMKNSENSLQAASLNKESRLILQKEISDKEEKNFEEQGCEVIHRLKGSTSLKCSGNVKINGAREERIFKIQDLWADEQINADRVWQSGYDGSGVTVAILDTGVETDHFELMDSIIATENFIETERSYDFIGHGTHVAGIITGDGDYEVDYNYATGVSPGADIMMGKVCDDYGCYESDIMAGIEWAVENNADIISMSLGGLNFYSHCDDDPLAAKVNWAVEQGVVVVAAAGNEGSGVITPACASKAIAVGAVDSYNELAYWSNYGDALDIVAPGVDILSTYSCLAAGDCRYYWYAYLSGTSMSTPHVAGVAALLLEKNPDYTVEQVKQAIYNTALDLGTPGYDIYYGHGVIDALAAINYDGNVTPIDYDNDGYASDVDCNDNNASINPGASEICNFIDDNCNSIIDEGFDLDGDNYTSCNNDCNDNNAGIYPGASDIICNGLDNDCDSLIDENYTSYSCGIGGCQKFSICSNGQESCTPGNPVAEICNDSIDNNCNGELDDGCVNELCWNGSNQYFVRIGSQIGKLCKCTTGSNTYRGYASNTTGNHNAYMYADAYNFTNWTTTLVLNYSNAVYKVNCGDAKWYYTNQDYYVK